MSQLLTPATFEFFANNLLAGYIVILARSWFILGLRPKPAELVVEAVVFSLIIQLLALLIGAIASIVGFSEWLHSFDWYDPSGLQIVFFLKILVLPTLLGIVLGWNLTAGWKHALLRRLSMPVVHPVQRAHDFAFGVDRVPGLVIVTYEDGSVVRGFFGEQSLASSDTNRSDIYLEQLYMEDEKGQWYTPTPARSALLTLHSVRSIEFLEPEGEKDVEG